MTKHRSHQFYLDYLYLAPIIYLFTDKEKGKLMVSLKTSLAYEAEEVASRSLKIMHSRGSFVTPIRALKAKGAENLRIDRRELRGVVEVYANFTLSKLEKARQNLIQEQTIEKDLQSASAKAYDNEAVIVIPNIEGAQTSINNPEKIGEDIAELILEVE